jgi:hypothetical protein
VSRVSTGHISIDALSAQVDDVYCHYYARLGSCGPTLNRQDEGDVVPHETAGIWRPQPSGSHGEGCYALWVRPVMNYRYVHFL